MHIRRVSGFALALAFVATAFVSSTPVRAADPPNPCSALPNGGTLRVPVPGAVIDPTCNTDCSGKLPRGIPMPSNPLLGFTGNDHAQCEIKEGPARGACKQDTVCPPGTSRASIDGVTKCRRPDETRTVTCPAPPPPPPPRAPPAIRPGLLAPPTLSALPSKVPGRSYEIGPTSALGRTLAELTGLRPMPPNFAQLVQQKFAKSTSAMAGFAPLEPAGCASKSSFSWMEKLGTKMPPVRDQGKCGSCWAFAAVGAFEIALANGGGTLDSQANRLKDFSEQELLSCASTAPVDNNAIMLPRVRHGSCEGGITEIGLDYLVDYGAVLESERPYRGADQKSGCVRMATKGRAWSYVRPDPAPGGLTEMKEALCSQGALVVALNVGETFKGYTGGIYDENLIGPTNHAVILVGWDDAKKAWIIRNSWGTDWGVKGPGTSERGYAYVKYGTNNLGFGAAYIR